jgi:hypothetical protein
MIAGDGLEGGRGEGRRVGAGGWGRAGGRGGDGGRGQQYVTERSTINDLLPSTSFPAPAAPQRHPWEAALGECTRLATSGWQPRASLSAAWASPSAEPPAQGQAARSARSARLGQLGSSPAPCCLRPQRPAPPPARRRPARPPA